MSFNLEDLIGSETVAKFDRLGDHAILVFCYTCFKALYMSAEGGNSIVKKVAVDAADGHNGQLGHQVGVIDKSKKNYVS